MDVEDAAKSTNLGRIRNLFSTPSKITPDNNTKYRIHVVTGDRKGAGTDANVYVIIRDIHGNKSSIIRPKTLFSNDHERATTTTVEVLERNLGIEPPFSSIQVWRDNFGNLPSFLGKLTETLFGGANKHGSAAWFLDRIEVEVTDDSSKRKSGSDIFSANNTISTSKNSSDLGSKFGSHSSLYDNLSSYIFPFQRWIEAKKMYEVDLYDTVVPQLDKRKKEREDELLRKRGEYCYVQNIKDGPAQAAFLPIDETFSEHYYWNFAKEKAKLIAKTQFIKWAKRKWNSIEEIKTTALNSFGKTECLSKWDSDVWFGLQRVQGVNPYVIRLCKEIPEKLGVTEEIMESLFECLTLKDAIEKNKIFICDLQLIDGIPCNAGKRLCAPVALFYLNNDEDLVPVAIQLDQQKGPENPVFTPKDPPNTWLVAKLYYNNAEAQHHQGISHLGLTHLLMEGICVCTHRHLSPSHPIFKLMAPHFLYLIAINTRGLEKLISPGGWVDYCMTQGIEGIYEVIRRGINNYNFATCGNVEKEINSRGLLDPKVLPHYPYRDDAVPLYKINRKYVSSIIHNYYDSQNKLMGDWELLEWRRELSKDRKQNGVGLIGVPGDDDKGFSTMDELIDTVTIIITTCSLGHSVTNFQQYEQYGFVPNYPGILMSDPPTQKRDYTENDILEILPDVETSLSSMVITKLLSARGTNSLGNFEVQYLYSPKDVAAADEFRKDIKKLSHDIKKNNVDRRHKFLWLDPEVIPNSISI